MFCISPGRRPASPELSALQIYETAEELLARVKAEHQAMGANGAAGKKRRGAKQAVGATGTAAKSTKKSKARAAG
jgi:hypothetical protein